jgi:hypothetical protein
MTNILLELNEMITSLHNTNLFACGPKQATKYIKDGINHKVLAIKNTFGEFISTTESMPNIGLIGYYILLKDMRILKYVGEFQHKNALAIVYLPTEQQRMENAYIVGTKIIIPYYSIFIGESRQIFFELDL